MNQMLQGMLGSHSISRREREGGIPPRQSHSKLEGERKNTRVGSHID